MQNLLGFSLHFQLHDLDKEYINARKMTFAKWELNLFKINSSVRLYITHPWIYTEHPSVFTLTHIHNLKCAHTHKHTHTTEFTFILHMNKYSICIHSCTHLGTQMCTHSCKNTHTHKLNSNQKDGVDDGGHSGVIPYLYKNFARLSFWEANFSITLELKSWMPRAIFFSMESIARALRNTWGITLCHGIPQEGFYPI